MADLWSARTYRSRDLFPRSEPIVFQKTLQVDEWHAEITIGPVPKSVMEAVAIEEGVMSFLLRALTGEGGGGRVVRDEMIDDVVSGYKVPPDWEDPMRLYTTMVIKRSVDIDLHPDWETSKYLWYDFRSAEMAVWQSADKAERGEVYERLLWYLLRHLDPRLLGDVMRPARAYLQIPSKLPCPVPRFTAGAVTVSRGLGIDDIEGQIADLQSSNDVPKRDTGLVRLSRFAMQKDAESDIFKRFFWCYAGLELAANDISKRLKADAKAAIRFQTPSGDGLTGLAAMELIWPDNEAPESRRSIVFRRLRTT